MQLAVFYGGFADGVQHAGAVLQLQRQVGGGPGGVDGADQLAALPGKRAVVALGLGRVQHLERSVGVQIPVGMAEGQQALHGMQQAVGVGLLGFDRGGVVGGIHRQVQRIRCGGGEAVVGGAVPLHRRAGAGAEIAALLGGQGQVAHADLIAVIHERCAGQSEQRGVGQPQFVHRQTGRGADGIVVAGDKAPQTVLFGGLVAGQVVVQKLIDAGAGVLAEVGLADVVRVGVGGTVVVAHQPAVAVALPLQIKVHIEAVFQRHARAVPLSHQGGFGVLLAQHGGYVAPDGTGVLFVLGVVFDKAGSHIHAETITAHVQPEPHDVLHGLDGSQAGGVGGGLLPGLVDLAVAVVQRGLALEEVQNVGTVARGLAADERHAVAGGKAGIGPDEAVGVFVVLGPAAGLEPGVFLAGVAGHQVEQHVDALLVGGLEQRGGVRVGAIARRNFFVVAHVVAGVFKRRVVAGVDPQRIAA